MMSKRSSRTCALPLSRSNTEPYAFSTFSLVIELCNLLARTKVRSPGTIGDGLNVKKLDFRKVEFRR
jgi:hypothetical protein